MPSLRNRIRARARNAARRAVDNIASTARRGLRRAFTREPEAPVAPAPRQPKRQEPFESRREPKRQKSSEPPPKRQKPFELPRQPLKRLEKPPLELPESSQPSSRLPEPPEPPKPRQSPLRRQKLSELPEPPEPRQASGFGPSIPDSKPLSEQERAQGETLLGELHELRSIIERLRELGMEQAAAAILGIPELPELSPVEPTPGLPEPGKLPEPPEFSQAPPEAPVKPPTKEQKKPAEQQEEEEIAQLPSADQGDKRYPLSGSSILIPFDTDPATVFELLLETWRRASPGSRRDPDTGRALDARPPFAPDAVAIGSDVDPGMQIPQEALVSPAAFVRWADSNGYQDGLAVEIDGLIAKPGRPILPTVARMLRDDDKMPRRPRNTTVSTS